MSIHHLSPTEISEDDEKASIIDSLRWVPSEELRAGVTDAFYCELLLGDSPDGEVVNFGYMLYMTHGLHVFTFVPHIGPSETDTLPYLSVYRDVDYLKQVVILSVECGLVCGIRQLR